mmetsp:Transcript_2606/g.7138  ORF Transcript_2606/g.7138 Transcript_2606/m.7138 type:complete len:102 (+) Transcript_2606:1884-2189(+)
MIHERTNQSIDQWKGNVDGMGKLASRSFHRSDRLSIPSRTESEQRTTGDPNLRFLEGNAEQHIGTPLNYRGQSQLYYTIPTNVNETPRSNELPADRIHRDV